MRSDAVLAKYKEKFTELMGSELRTQNDRVVFLRKYLALLNEFLFERREEEEIDALNEPDEGRPEWQRITPFLAIWDDYAESVIGFSFDTGQIRKLAELLTVLYQEAPAETETAASLPPDEEIESLGGATPRQFCLLRVMHALQDFSRVLASLDADLLEEIRHTFGGGIPDEEALSKEENAERLMRVFGRPDRNVEERVRYIYSSARMLHSLHPAGAYGLLNECSGNVERLYEALTSFPGLKRKKASMLLRDFYDLRIWQYTRNIRSIGIIPDNRVMRIALRTGIIRSAMGKLVNSLLDEFDLQYVLTTTATEEAFRRVWEVTQDFNEGIPVVPFPAKMDELIFRLGHGQSGCCKPNDIACRGGNRRRSFESWFRTEFGRDMETPCPFVNICPEEAKDIQAPFAVQNRTWMTIFTGKGGGGGLRGV